jgi:multicomponent Na+:H+ antiporter subunit A
VWAVLGLHGAVALALALVGERLGRRAFLLAAVAPLLTFGYLLSEMSTVVDGSVIVQAFSWVPQLGFDVDLRLDGLGLLMAMLVSGIGALIFIYSRWYFSNRPGLGRVASLLVAFAGSMLGLVLSDNLLALYLFWELTSVTSFLLIGFEDDKSSARSAAQQAFLVTGTGGLAMLGGFVLLAQTAGTWSLSELLADPPSGGRATVAVALILLGAFTKSAQVPFHFWLPGAMAAPTPISAYLHSATMVKAGVYLIARLAPAFAGLLVFWRPVVIGVGVATMLLGGVRALKQHDLKLLLAHGTVSQLGFMVVLVGAGIPELTFAGCAVILGHALFKATLFMVVGIVDHQTHTRDVRKLDGLSRAMPATFAVAVIATASMAGAGPLFGFVAKEAAYEGLIDAAVGAGWSWAFAGVLVGSILTFGYGARFLWGGFGPGDGSGMPAEEVQRPPWPFLAPAALLAALTVLWGLLPALPDGLVLAAARSLVPTIADKELYLWHGVNAALLFSLLTVLAGLALFWLRDRIEAGQSKVHLAGMADLYQWSLRSLLHGADRLTGIVQNGSLPVYITVILLTTIALPASALIGQDLELSPDFAEGPLQVFVVALVIVAGIAMALARRRFTAVLLLGAVGFGVAVLFVIQGAPDLALTQLLIETLALVMFVLVLRHLPERFERIPWRAAVAPRVAISAGVGVFVGFFALVAGSARTEPPVSTEQIARAYPEAGGQNVVNVILTDFRALDTVGEITVLLVAGVGIATLVFAGRRRSGMLDDRDHHQDDGDADPATGAGPGAGRDRSEAALPGGPDA